MLEFVDQACLGENIPGTQVRRLLAHHAQAELAVDLGDIVLDSLGLQAEPIGDGPNVVRRGEPVREQGDDKRLTQVGPDLGVPECRGERVRRSRQRPTDGQSHR